MTAPQWRWLDRQRRPLALLVSAAVHAVLLVLVGRLTVGPVPAPDPIPGPTVVWLRDWAPQEPPAPPAPEPRTREPRRDRGEPAPTQPAEALATAPGEAVSEPKAPDPPVPQPSPARAVADASRDTLVVTPAPADPVIDTETDRRTRESAPEPSALDYGAVRQLAVTHIADALERERGRIVFSTENPDDEATARGPPGAIFDAPRSPRARALSPGRARTRVGRFAAELCNALTGGFGLGGILSPLGITVCADGEIYGTYFAHLKPDYMIKRPHCEEPESLDPLMAEISRRNGIPTTKCRLVYADELEALLDPLDAMGDALARQ